MTFYCGDDMLITLVISTTVVTYALITQLLPLQQRRQRPRK